MKLALLTGLLSASLTPAALAQLSLPAIVSDGMVLQRETEVPIWGWAKPGTEVAVKGGWLGSWIAATSATADDTGRWQVMLRTPEAWLLWWCGIAVRLKAASPSSAFL